MGEPFRGKSGYNTWGKSCIVMAGRPVLVNDFFASAAEMKGGENNHDEARFPVLWTSAARTGVGRRGFVHLVGGGLRPDSIQQLFRQ
jgi:hypothetical protein